MPDTDLGSSRRARLASARLYLICDCRRELTALLDAAIDGGVDVVQLRDKRLDERELADAAKTAALVCRERGVLLIVNDHPRAALVAGADGVHLGQADMALEEARALAGDELLIGLSTHSRAQIDAASQAASDRRPSYIGVGPVFATPTKPGRPPVGLELVRYAAAHADLPFFAIGGIETSNASAVIDAGARRLAVVRAIAEAKQPADAARALRAALEQESLDHADRAARAA